MGASSIRRQSKKEGIMKTIALTLFAATLGLAQSSSVNTDKTATDKTAPTAQSKKAAQSDKPSPDQANGQKPKVQAQPPAQSIPDGAKLVEPNLYRYTDSNGKTWNYRRTPFGLTKWEEMPVPAAQPAHPKSDPIVVTDLGDSYRFEQKTPFGQSSWVRRKSELTDQEKALTGGQQTQSSANPSNTVSQPAGNQ
jgi:hypothetical protein